jgi:murein DD-endopeptidase MepM/ murein hydrolase activator NlpD
MTVLLVLLAAVALASEPRVFVKARAAQPGEALLIAVSGHHDSDPPSGRLGEVPLSFQRTRRGTWISLAGVDLDVSTGPLRLTLALKAPGGGKSSWDEDLLVEPKEFPTQKLRVMQKFVNPVGEDSSRAEEESKKLRSIFSGSTDKRMLTASFVSPIIGAQSSRFGERRVFNNVPKAPHSGADLRAPEGALVSAPAGGQVALAGDLFYQGKTVVLDHGYGLYSMYAHLSETLVKEGDVLAQGAPLGKVGATGRVTGPHLHWAVKTPGARIDPFSLTALDLQAWLE